MAQQPNLHNIHLESCCKRSLNDINRKMDAANLLQGLIGVSPLIQVLTSTKSYEAIHTVNSTDWVALTQAMKAVPAIRKKVLQDIASNELLLNHPHGELNKFWKAMYNSYS